MLKSKYQESVLIVGAGPAGMLLALELAIHGIYARIISKTPRISPHSKATIVWPRILELMERTGIAENIVEQGHYFNQMNYYSNKKMVGLIRFDNLKHTAYPFGITIPQWKTEKILETALSSIGINIEYGAEFIRGEQESNGIDVEIQSKDGTISKSFYDYVIGADGFNSTVRKEFSFDFDGFSLETKLAITDAEIIGQTTSTEAAYYLHKTGNMVLAPLGDGIFRVGASVPPGAEKSELNADFFNQLLAERVPGNKKLGRMNFSGIFTAHVRTANSFRKGNVFLIGDAAHAMSPSGAQGLNTGFQDAVNLGWKLGGVLTGKFPKCLLDTYSPERIDSVNRVSNLSTSLAKLSLLKARPQTFLRDSAFRLASATGIMKNYVSPKFCQLDTYVGGQRSVIDLIINKNFKEGDRLPLGWAHNWNSPVLSKDNYTLLLWPGHSYSYEDWTSKVNDIKSISSGIKVIDLGGRPIGCLAQKLGTQKKGLLVRPDGHIESIFQIPGQLGLSAINSIFSRFVTLSPKTVQGAIYEH
jgi:2-polyprenyl-6-methoxyphenol hydroxylase-like FAD-dependent oxidoreductase